MPSDANGAPPGQSATDRHSTEVTGILLVTIPVTDLAVSAAWYRDLLNLQYVREFETGGEVTACGLTDQAAGYGVQLRARTATAAQPDLRGVHPLVLQVTDQAALHRVRAHAASLGYDPTAGEHDDGAWVEVLDPDGIVIRFMATVNQPTTFTGYRFDHRGIPTKYDDPRLELPSSPA